MNTNVKYVILAFIVVLTLPAFARPSAPVLTVETNGRFVSTSWSEAAGADGYYFNFVKYPNDNDKPYTKVDLRSRTELSGKLKLGAAYYVAISAYDQNGESELSNIVLVNLSEQQMYLDYVKNAEIQESEWIKYSDVLSQIEPYYEGYPVTLNTSALWFKSIEIPIGDFSTGKSYFPVDAALMDGVGYGSSTTIGKNTQFIFFSYWVPGKPNAGTAFAVRYENSQPVMVDTYPIEGATYSWPIKQESGNEVAVFLGVDEGKLSMPGSNANSPTYFYEIEKGTWAESDYLTASHNSIPFDYDSDGDEDIVAQSWDEPFQTNLIIENTSGGFIPVQLGQNSYPHIGGMAIAPLGFQEDQSFPVVITDGNSFPEYNVEPERNFIAYLSTDLSIVDAIKPLPTPYFERDSFEGIQQIADWEGTVGLSHDVSARAIDIDYDNDLDIVISSMIWSDENPYVVLQFLINKNGEYYDETDTRLFNWSFIGEGLHRVDYEDVNGDGFVDILVSDHGYPWRFHNWTINGAYLSGSRVLLNDGNGHFVVSIHQQINDTGEYLQSHIPSLDASGKLKWTVVNARGSAGVENPNLEIITRKVNTKLSTGPNGIDPALYGVPDYNEFYYLLHNEDVQDMVINGDYISGFAHYLDIGKYEGRAINAHIARSRTE